MLQKSLRGCQKIFLLTTGRNTYKICPGGDSLKGRTVNRFRRQRFQMLFETFQLSEESRVLDLGGLPYDWVELDFPGQVVCVSLSAIREGTWGKGNILYVRKDVFELDYSPDDFDVVYSNSLLEHVGRENQPRLAGVVRRFPSYWVQVPYRYFPIEPHYRAPFFWSLPQPVRRMLARRWTSILARRNYYQDEVDSMWLLDREEMKTLFPEAQIIEEKVLGIVKSLIALRRA